MVPLHQRAHATDLERREPRAGPVRRAAVVGDAEEDRARARLDPGRERRDGEPEERDLPVAQVGEGGLLGHRISSRRAATRADERAQQLERDAGAPVAGRDGERRAVRLALAHEAEDVADRAAALGGDEAGVGEELAAEPHVVGAEDRLALGAEDLVLEPHQLGKSAGTRGRISRSLMVLLLERHRTGPS